MRLNTNNLRNDEADLLLDLLNQSIVEHKIVSKTSLLAGDINKARYDWHQGHSRYLEEIFFKLTGQVWKL